MLQKLVSFPLRLVAGFGKHLDQKSLRLDRERGKIGMVDVMRVSGSATSKG